MNKLDFKLSSLSKDCFQGKERANKFQADLKTMINKVTLDIESLLYCIKYLEKDLRKCRRRLKDIFSGLLHQKFLLGLIIWSRILVRVLVQKITIILTILIASLYLFLTISCALIFVKINITSATGSLLSIIEEEIKSMLNPSKTQRD